jgi:hypothetical protein
VGERDVTLRALGLVPKPPGPPEVQTEFEIAEHGKKARGFRFSEEIELSDATGNVSRSRSPLPLSEAAWKVKGEFVQTSDYPFAPGEGMVFGPLPIPDVGKFEVLKVPDGQELAGFRTAVLVGPGRYHWQDGALAGEEWAPGDPEYPPNSETMFASKTPALCLLNIDQVRRIPEAWRTFAAQMEWAGQRYGLVYERPIFSKSNYSPIIVLKWNGEDNPPPPGTPVLLQLVPTKVESFEFFVAPPKLPEATAE